MTTSSQPSPGQSAGPPLERELTSAVASVRSLFQAAACSCALVVADGSALRFTAADGVGAAAIMGQSVPVVRGIVGWVALSGQPIAVADVAVDSRFARDVAESTDYVPTRILAAPLVSGDGEVRGVLEVLDPAASTDSDWWLAVLGTVASQVAALVALLQNDDRGDTDSLRAAAASLAGAGPEASLLAERVVTAVAEYLKAQG